MSPFRTNILLLSAVFLAAGAASAEPLAHNAVVAVVNDEIITTRDIEEKMASVAQVAKQLYPEADLAARLANARREVLQQLIDEKLLYQEAKRQIAKNPARQRQVDRALEAHMKKLEEKAGSKEALREQSERGGLTPEQEKEKWRRWIMVQMILSEHVYRHVSVSPADIRRYYREHLDEFTQKREVKFRWIVLRADPNDPVEREQVRLVAQSIYDRLRRGASFERLAREYSDVRAEDGGLWDFTSTGTIYPEVNKALFKLKRGEYSKVIETRGGFHLLKVVDVRGGTRRSFDDIQENIEQRLKDEQTRKLREAYVKHLRDAAYVKIRSSAFGPASALGPTE